MQNTAICFHGTDRARANDITDNGFKKGTYFAKHLEDALEFGGSWVFQVCFEEAKIPPGCWQFQIVNSKPETDIVGLTHYVEIEKVFENSDLRQRIFEAEEIDAFDSALDLCRLEIKAIELEAGADRELLKIRMDTIMANLGIAVRRGYRTAKQKEDYEIISRVFTSLQHKYDFVYKWGPRQLWSAVQ